MLLPVKILPDLVLTVHPALRDSPTGCLNYYVITLTPRSNPTL